MSTPSTRKKYPPFLDNNPDIMEAIVSYCNSSLLDMSTYSVQEFIIGTCLPQLLEQRQKELNDPTIDMDFVKKENNISSLCKQTISNWLEILGFTYCQRKKVTIVIAMKRLRMLLIGTNISTGILRENLGATDGSKC